VQPSEFATQKLKSCIMTKFDLVTEKGTSAGNYSIYTEDIIEKLEKWDSKYNIEVSEVGYDRLTVKFGSLPNNLEDLAKEIYEFCPDIIHQGCEPLDMYVEGAKERGEELATEVAELVEVAKLVKDGNFEKLDELDVKLGLILIQRYLKSHKSMEFWWD